MGRPESVEQHAEPEVDATAAEEERPDEEEAGEEDADPGVRTVGEVLVHGTRARVLPGVERDRVRDRENADARKEHCERCVPARTNIRARNAAKNECNREHGADRERLRDGVHGREVLLAERSLCAVALRGLAHAINPPVLVGRLTSACVLVAATI